MTLQRQGNPLTGFHSRKEEALLCYLLVTGRPQSRPRLAGLFWGDRSEERASGNLRRALTHLRGIVGEYLTITRREVTFNRDADYWLDVEQFERQARLGEDVGLDILQEAAELYKGEFLVGFFVKGAPDFEEWALREQERLHGLAVGVLHELISRHRMRGEYEQAITYARRLLALDPWLEETHRDLMALLALAGRRSEALSQYETCRRLLKRELGVEPMPETTSLYRRLVAWRGDALAVDREETPGIVFPLVGREREHATLISWWEEARHGTVRLTLVEGEVGVGKSRLVSEVIRYVQAQGTEVLQGRCYEFGRNIPYQPVAEALRAHFRESRLFERLSPVWLVDLSRLVPELRETHAELPYPVDDETARLRLFESVSRYLLSVEAESVVLFLDDLQWADSSTLDMLHYLVRRLDGSPFWLIGTYRSEEISLNHPLARFRQSLKHDDRLHHLSLRPLAPLAVHELAQALVGQNGQTLGEFLYRESKGNPFILGEIVNSLHESGLLQGKRAGRWLWRGSVKLSEALPSVQDVILQRVKRLGKQSHRLLTLAAVIGRPFDVTLLQAAADLSQSVVEEYLHTWLERRLVKVELDSRQYDFSHDKIRAVVYESADPALRVFFHRRIGESLEHLYAGQLEKVYEQLAYHYGRSGDLDKLLHYLPLAADKAVLLYAHKEALLDYERALALMLESESRYPMLLLQKGQVLRFLNRYDEAIAACLQVIDLTSQQPDLAVRAANELSAIYLVRREYDQAQFWSDRAYRWAQARTQVARAKTMQGEIEQARGNLLQAEQLFTEALAIYREVGQDQGAATSLEGLGYVFKARGQYDVARQYFEQALDIYHRIGDRQREAICLQAISRTYWRQDRNQAAHQAIVESLAICREIGDRKGEAAGCNMLGIIHITQGNDEETQSCWEKSAALYRSLGLDSWTTSVRHNLAILHLDRGEYDIAQRYLEGCLVTSRNIGAQLSEALDLGWLGKLYYLRGEYDVARHYLQMAIQMDEAIGGSEEEIWHRAWLGGTLNELGELAMSLQVLRDALQRVPPGDVAQTREVYQYLAPVYLELERGAEALKIVHAILQHDPSTPHAQAQYYALLGCIHGSGQLIAPENPVPYFEQALRLLENLPAQVHNFERGIILRRYGAYLLFHGDVAKGKQYLQQAAELFERIGARGELDKVLRLLNDDPAMRLRY